MSDIKAVVDDYIATWNERDPNRRRELVERAFADDATYLDSARSGEGHAELDTMIEAAQGHFPGHHIELVFGPDQHNDRVRFAWQLFGPDGLVFGGTDFAIVAPDGRLGAVTGFPDPVT